MIRGRFVFNDNTIYFDLDALTQHRLYSCACWFDAGKIPFIYQVVPIEILHVAFAGLGRLGFCG